MSQQKIPRTVILSAFFALAGLLIPAVSAADAAADPFEGSYVGSFKPMPAGKKGDYGKQSKCGSCHMSATVRAQGEAYVLTLSIRRGKGKKRIVLKGKKEGKKVVFQNGTYSITLADGKLTGDRKGKLVAKLDMSRPSEKQAGGQPDGSSNAEKKPKP